MQLHADYYNQHLILPILILLIPFHQKALYTYVPIFCIDPQDCRTPAHSFSDGRAPP